MQCCLAPPRRADASYCAWNCKNIQYKAGPDLVGLSDVAEILGMTRQNMRKLMLANSATFPAPVHEGSAVIWHLEPVLQWMRSRGYGIEQRQIDVAQVAMQINLVKESDRIGVSAQPEIRTLIA